MKSFDWMWLVTRSEEGLCYLSQKNQYWFRLSSSFSCGQKDFEFGLYLLRNLQWCSLHEEIFRQTHSCQRWACSHNKPLSHFSRRELITFPAHAVYIQHEFLFLIRRKALIVEWHYQIPRLININKRNENMPAVVIVHTFLWASEICWWLDIWK